MLIASPIHYFNEIQFTSWHLWLLALCVFFFFILNLFDDVIYESRMNGCYNRKIRAALVCGFICFLISEVLLFGGFFWAYFDRVFNPGYIVGSLCIPSGMENIDYWRWPLVGTFVLVTSGYFANHAYYFLRAGSWVHCVVYGIVTLILAVSFLLVQLVEYNGLNIRISDNVFGSFFYLLTGFHGFHVTVGLLFLCEQYSRVMIPLYRHRLWRVHRVNYIFNRDRHLGMAFALIYWHFVDIIWIFLFFNVYVLNNFNLSDWDYASSRLVYVFTESNLDILRKDPDFFLYSLRNGYRDQHIAPSYQFFIR
jgi:cytochrome c oxidase subunit 3